MATKNTLPVPKGSHAPVSNLSEEAAAAETPKSSDSRPPAEGKSSKATKPRKDGAEDVPGFKGLKESAAAGTESLTAPKTTKLKDIGEHRLVLLRPRPKPFMVRITASRLQILPSIPGGHMHLC
jgi:hypothetical protein